LAIIQCCSIAGTHALDAASCSEYYLWLSWVSFRCGPTLIPFDVIHSSPHNLPFGSVRFQDKSQPPHLRRSHHPSLFCDVSYKYNGSQQCNDEAQQLSSGERASPPRQLFRIASRSTEFHSMDSEMQSRWPSSRGSRGSYKGGGEGVGEPASPRCPTGRLRRVGR